MLERRRRINAQLYGVAIVNTHNPQLEALASSPFDQARDIPIEHTSDTYNLFTQPASPTHPHSPTSPSHSSLSSSPTSHSSSSSSSSSYASSPSPRHALSFRGGLSTLVPQSVAKLPWYQRIVRRNVDAAGSVSRASGGGGDATDDAGQSPETALLLKKV